MFAGTWGCPSIMATGNIFKRLLLFFSPKRRHQHHFTA